MVFFAKISIIPLFYDELLTLIIPINALIKCRISSPQYQRQKPQQ